VDREGRRRRERGKGWLTNLVEVDGLHACHFHPITQVHKIFIRAFLLLSHQPVSAKRTKKIFSFCVPYAGMWMRRTYPLTLMINPAPNSIPMLNCALFGTSWNCIWARRWSIRVIEIDSGRMVRSSSVKSLESSSREESERLFGRRTDYMVSGRETEGKGRHDVWHRL
jgi:hypothetical protein